MVRKIELNVGDRYGHWTVEGEAPLPHKKGGASWCCRCSCGVVKNVPSRRLRTGESQSCGCSVPKAELKKQWSGAGTISGTYWGSILINARKRKLPVDLTIEEAWTLLENQHHTCALSGLALVTGTASLDRIDSTKGYTLGNVQWVHKLINRMKMDMTDSEFVRLCGAVVAHHSK